MRTTFRTVLFWGALALAGLMVLAIALGRGAPDHLATMLAALGYAVAGRLVIARRPRNAVGWILALIAIALATAGLADGYVERAPADDPLLPYADWLSEFVSLLWLPALVAIALPLVFPDGRVFWRWVVWTGVAGAVLGTIGTAFTPGPMEAKRNIENPFGIAGLEAARSVADGLGTVLLIVSAIGAAISVIVRLRRARGIERQQLKWFAYVASVIVAAVTVATATALGGDAAWVDVVAPIAGLILLAMVGFGIPIATGVALLRYRLYEIDVVIKRTLVYSALTATLGAAYLAGVLLLQLVLSPSSDLAIAGSTLAAALLFRPARARIQSAVDRRFYRRAYDAARTIERFRARTRDEVSLEALSEELRAVVADTMQPEHVSLWLKEPAR